jgi:membrane protein DedA with SNARE-associated domain
MSAIDKILTLPFPLLHHWGYVVLFLATIVEAMPFGVFIPGHTLIIVAGFLAREGVFKIGDVILVASLGAIIGDVTGYILGKKYGYPFISKHGSKFFMKKERFKKFRKMINTHAAKAVIIGRYSPGTRSFAPFISGASHLPFRKFILLDIIGGISWTLSAVFIGFIFGHGYEAAAKYINRGILFAVIAAIVVIYVIRSIKKKKQKYYISRPK